MTIRRGLPPLLLSLMAVLAAACTSEEAPKVQIGTVARAPVSEVVEAPATVGARATATLRSPAAGTVAKVYVQDGDKVTKGQILVRISSPQARDQLAQARRAERQASASPRAMSVAAAPGLRLPAPNLTASLDREVARGFARARAAARKVEDRRVRAQLLAAIDAARTQHRAQSAALNQITRDLTRSVNRSLSQMSGQIGAGLGGLTASMASLRSASASQARALAKAAQATVDGLVVKAPFGGIVTLGGAPGGGGANLGALLGQLPPALAGQAGAAAGGASGGGAAPSAAGGTIASGVPVSAGDALVTVTDVSKLSLSADVDETDVLLVGPGVRAEAELDAVTGATYKATVTGVGVTPKEGTTGGVSYPVRLALGAGTYDGGDAAPAPKPGMSAVVRLTVRESPDAVAVPASSVVTSGRETVLWVVRGDGTAERRVVTLGAQGEAMVEVTRGLTLGERVVVRGADSVRPGQTLP
ncbi:efflux RND transporter periplasmic adaptor subunit [Sphaerisporangium krabiense]|uniref:Multidrug efflux pump subunit AcrA (Membrane-fusion protein) n=1 Tax=Sphaerisporangium krabiense TaxID=763782 RepID=A0A7W9DPN4_9ACTN|nr:biotin/lipoyl-binding protein [Sphaerisporangium krabiense]MBB5625525.1 multidrug efflux pump subunit AcrA (membrane-fusion protein) [Sphaerisporangium krabiense]